MAQSVVINDVTYPAVPAVQVPKSGGGTATFYDTSDSNADAAVILAGYSSYGPAGKIAGTLTTPSVSQDSSSKILTIS